MYATKKNYGREQIMKFEVGEIAEIRPRKNHPDEGWRECTLLRRAPIISGRDWWVQVNGVRNPLQRDGAWLTHERHLRKKKPPKEARGTWEKIEKFTKGWNPTRETLDA